MLEITVDMNHSQPMVKSRLRNEQVGDWSPVPHSVMVGKISLQMKCALEQVGRRRDNSKVRM